MDEAADILAQVRELNPEAPGLMERQHRLTELERQRIEQAIQEHWVAFEEALEAEDLDEAEHILSEVHGP